MLIAVWGGEPNEKSFCAFSPTWGYPTLAACYYDDGIISTM